MRQQTLAASDFDIPRSPTRRELFLEEMEKVVPWERLCKLIEPHYPKAGNGRRPIGLERMLRIHFLQKWFNMSDLSMEEALYDSRAMCRFAGIDLGRERSPDATTILKFRRLLEEHGLGEQLFAEVAGHLHEEGLAVSNGTIVDASFIEAPSSTKNKDRERDPEMSSGKKGNQWHFGMKLHVGVDSKTAVAHTMVVTAANVHDSEVLGDLLHGEETRVWGDSGYTGKVKDIRRAAANASDFTNERGARGRPLTESQKLRNRTKSRIRAKVEYMFRVIKNQFGFTKARYRGIAKNANALFTLGALANLYLVRRQMLRPA